MKPKLVNVTVEAIDAILPQTQCGDCEYDGCLPYADAIVTNHERIDRCLPGGTATLAKLGALTGIDPAPYMTAMQDKQKPAQTVRIQEEVCIGCTKCIQACPVDAIIGAAKQMHTVITDECTGCELCIPPCPVDCIEIIAIPELTEIQKQQKAMHYRERYQFRNERLARNQAEKKSAHQQAKSLATENKQATIEARKAEIQAAIARSKAARLAKEAQ